MFNSKKIEEILADLHARAQEQTAAMTEIGKLQTTLTNTVMTHHILVRELVAALAEGSPETIKKVRQKLDVLRATSTLSENQKTIARCIEMLPSQDQKT